MVPQKALPVAKLPVKRLRARSRWRPRVCGPASPGLQATRAAASAQMTRARPPLP